MENLHFSFTQNKYEHQYESADYQNPITQQTIGHEWRFDDHYKRFNSFDRPPFTSFYNNSYHYPHNTYQRRGYSIIRRGRGSRRRHHLDDIYLPNYDSELSEKVHIRDQMKKNRYYCNNRIPASRNKRFSASSTRTVPEKYEMKTREQQTPNPIGNLNSNDKCMETNSSVKVYNEICTTKSFISTVEVECRKNSGSSITSVLKSHARVMRPNDDGRNDTPIVAERKEECSNPKHSTSVTVKKCPLQKDPRSTGITTKSTDNIYLKILKWNDIKRSQNKMQMENELVTRPVNPKKKSTSLIIKSSETDNPKPKNSIHMKYRCDFKQNRLGVSDYHTSQKTETIEYKNSFERNGNCIRKATKKKGIHINRKSTNVKEFDKKTKIIMDKKFVCRCNRSVIKKFSGRSFPTSKLCCHVYIKKGECDSIGKKHNRINFLDIDKTYSIPGDNCSVSASNLEENISENSHNVSKMNKNESKQKSIFDKTEQNEEMELLPETEKQLVRNSTEDIVKNSADHIIVLPDKIVPKELFMQIYNKKPIKVSAAPDSLDKANHTIRVNCNSEMDQRKIVKSVPKSTSLGNRIRKKLYDPVSDSNVYEKRLRELFDDDLSDLTLGSDGSFVDKLENSTESEFLAKSKLKRKSPFKQKSLTCEDANVPPKKKISKRRKTIYFSSFLKDTEISMNNTPAKTSPSIEKKITMTNVSTHSEKVKQIETPKSSQVIMSNSSGTSEATACASVATETTQLNAKEITMADVNNHLEKIKQLETPKNTSQDGDVSETTIIPNSAPESISSHVEQQIVSRYRNESKTTTSSSYISPENSSEKNGVRCSPENGIQQMMSELIKVTERHTGNGAEELEFFIKDTHHKECDVNIKISNPHPFNYNAVKLKNISMPELEVIEQREIKEETSKDTAELTFKFAISLKTEDECNEELMSICDRPEIESSFAVSSEVSEYLVVAVFNLNNVQYSVKANANQTHPFSPPHRSLIRVISNSSDTNQSPKIFALNIYPDEFARIYLQFYEEVVYILKGYIPLQRTHSALYTLVYETFRRFPHSLNEFSRESLSLDMIAHNRRTYYSQILLRSISKLPSDLPNFHFAHFLRLTTELLNRSGISINILTVVQHLLAVMIACNLDYKQNKTCDTFKKFLESWSVTFNKNGTHRPESGLTFTQNCLLKTQILTYLKLYQTQNIYRNFERNRSENSTHQTQHSLIQNSNQSNRTSKPMQYTEHRSILSNKSSDIMQHIVSNTSYMTSSSSRLPPVPPHQCTSEQANVIDDDSNNTNTVTDKIKISKNPPVNKMTINLVIPKIPMINSSVLQSREKARPNLLQIIPPMTNSTIQSSHFQKSASVETHEENCMTRVSSGNVSSINDKVNGKKASASDSTVLVNKDNSIILPKESTPHSSLISNVSQVEDNSMSKDLIVGPSRGNQPQSIQMTTSSTSDVSKLQTQSSDNHNVFDSNEHISYGVIKAEKPLDNSNIDVRICKSSNETKKYESSNECVDSAGSSSSDAKIEEETVEKFAFYEDEIIDLTWIDDFTEEELRNFHEFMYSRDEPSVACIEVPSSPGDSGIDSPQIEREYPMLLLENRSCLCGRMAVYLCHCNTVMYCSQQCQLTDWPKHRKSCHSSYAI